MNSSYCPANTMRPASEGFTLLELLIAMAIFAIMAALAYGGLASVLTARENISAEATRLRNIQQLMLMLERDLDQLADRSMRDEYGDRQPALRGGEDWFEFTRSGWSNPAEQLRSDLQRVAYTLRERRVIRAYWQVLDRAQDSAPLEMTLLDPVLNLRLRYLDANRQWLADWPPPTIEAAAETLPIALELHLELEDWGNLTRLFRIR
ncbi:MAG: type II secretion system minor pseudopilin GspJ [Thiohalomonadaceae bacterium]